MGSNTELSLMKIGLLLSENYGLNTWEKLGSLTRELKIYDKLAEEGNEVVIFSFNKVDEKRILNYDIRIKALPLSRLPASLVLIRQILFPFCYYRTLKQANVIITNQAHNGGWVAIWAKIITGVKIVARCGYVFGEQMSVQKFTGSRHRKRRWLERTTHKYADVSIVPTEELKTWLGANYKVPIQQIRVIPNFVDTSLFKPAEIIKEYDIISVGRLHDEKRPYLILHAARRLKFSVLLIGFGILEKNLVEFASKNGIKLTIINSFENKDLPKLLNKAKYFVTGSRREGHPKAIIEAMSCGCVCICPDVAGINNLIRDGETGLLYNGTSEGLTRTVKYIESDPILYNLISLNAREFCLNNFDFESIYSKYTDLISDFVSDEV